MADGETTLRLALTLSDQAVRHLKEGAAKLGLSLEAYAAEIVEQQLLDYGDYDWGDDPANDPGAPVEPFDPNEPTYSLEEVMVEFDAELEKRLAARRRGFGLRPGRDPISTRKSAGWPSGRHRRLVAPPSEFVRSSG